MKKLLTKITKKIEEYEKILYGFLLTIFIWTLGIILFSLHSINLHIVGGKLYFYILFLVGSLNFIYSSLYFLRLKRKKINIKDFFKTEASNDYKKKNKYVKIVALILFLLVFTVPFLYVQVSYIVIDEQKDLQNVVNNLIRNSNNDYDKILSLLSWFNRNDTGSENISNLYHRFSKNQILLYFSDFYNCGWEYCVV